MCKFGNSEISVENCLSLYSPSLDWESHRALKFFRSCSFMRQSLQRGSKGQVCFSVCWHELRTLAGMGSNDCANFMKDFSFGNSNMSSALYLARGLQSGSSSFLEKPDIRGTCIFPAVKVNSARLFRPFNLFQNFADAASTSRYEYISSSSVLFLSIC